MTYETAFSALGLLGVGGLVGTWIKTLLDRRTAALKEKHELKESRYRCVLVLMYALLNDYERLKKLSEVRPDISSEEELRKEIEMEWHNMILVASDSVLRAVHDFAHNPTQEHFKKTAIEMRRDLWGGTIVTDLDRLNFDFP